MCKFKLSRLLCLLFALIFCFQGFGLGVSAASDGENLVDSDLRNWSETSDTADSTYVFLKGIDSFGSEVFELHTSGVPFSDNGYYVRASYIYDIADLTAGNSYTFKFHLLSFDEYSFFNSMINSSDYYRGLLAGGRYIIGLASYNSSSDELSLISDCSFIINKNNYNDFFGKNSSLTFELPNIVNPCILIAYQEASPNNLTQITAIKDVVLVDNESEKEDGFFARLFEWFQDKFDSIGESFSNLGNKLTDLKDGFVSKITDLKDSFVNKITELKDSFVEKIENLKQSVIDLGNNILEGIKRLFVPDEQVITDLKVDFDNLLRDHLGIIYTCTDLFSDFLNKAFDIIFDAPDTYGIVIPEVSFKAAGTTVPVFSAQSIDFSFMEKPIFQTMYSIYKVALYILFGGLEVKYALATYRKVINN